MTASLYATLDGLRSVIEGDRDTADLSRFAHTVWDWYQKDSTSVMALYDAAGLPRPVLAVPKHLDSGHRVPTPQRALDLLRLRQEVSQSELTLALGNNRSSVNSVIARLRRKGIGISTRRVDGVTLFRLTAA